MKFIKHLFHNGDTRLRTFFAWLPVSWESGRKRETRWLEVVTVHEQYVVCQTGNHGWQITGFQDNG